MNNSTLPFSLGTGTSRALLVVPGFWSMYDAVRPLSGPCPAGAPGSGRPKNRPIFGIIGLRLPRPRAPRSRSLELSRAGYEVGRP